MLTAKQIADFFLVLAAPDDGDATGEGLTHLKLQKLLYYAQGFFLAAFGVPLFRESIEAWEHGPVVREMYRQFAGHGRGPIPAPNDFDSEAYPDEVRGILIDVWNGYGQFSAWKLRNLTHQEPPWCDAYALGENSVITHDALIRYFKTQLQ